MRVLIIDNTLDRDSWGSRNLVRSAKQTPASSGATIHVRRGPHDDFPSDLGQYDRLIVSGSRTSAMADAPWISRLHETIRRWIDSGKPLLGVCYGHQSLVRALGSAELVRKGAKPEFGWTKIEVVRPSKIFEGLPKEFYSFSSHYEEVSRLPKGLAHVARSSECAIQACELEDRPVFGIQFHPEKNLAEGQKELATRKKTGEPKELLHPEDGPKLYDPAVAERIFGNFLKL